MMLLVSGSLVAGYAATAMRPSVSVLGASRCDVLMQQGISCTVEKRPKSAVALQITIPEDMSKDIHMKVMDKLAKNAKVPGFRPGKVPAAAVAAHIGQKRVKSATVEQLIDVGMQQSGSQVRLHTVGEARLEEEVEELEARYKIGEEVSFSVIVDVYPQVPLTPEMYEGLEVSVPDVPFNQEAYDGSLRKLRDQHADLVEAAEGTEAVFGQQLLVNMDGFFKAPDGSKGEPLPSIASGDGVQMPLMPGKFMPGLVEGLVGVKKDETRSITVTFPPRSSAPQLAGKEAIFEVSCLKVQDRVYPEVNDDFADKVKPGMSWAELDEKLREGVELEMAERKKGMTHQELQKALVTVLPDDFEVPETLQEQVAKERFAMMLSDMREKGATDEDLKEIITTENYERYKKISQNMIESQVSSPPRLPSQSTHPALASMSRPSNPRSPSTPPAPLCDHRSRATLP